MPRSTVRPLPRFVYGHMPEGTERTLYHDNRLFNRSGKVMPIQGRENLFQIPRRPAGLNCLLRIPFLP